MKRTPNARRHTVVADRESDIYEALCGFNTLKCDFVIRAQYLGRTLNSLRSGHSLQQELAQWARKDSFSLDLPPIDKRSAHTALMDIKFGVVLLARPHSGVVNHLPKTVSGLSL